MKQSTLKRLAGFRLFVVTILLLALTGRISAQTATVRTNEFSFVVAGDMRNFVEPLLRCH